MIDLSTHSSEQLCLIVVAHRSFGFNKDMAIQAMKELDYRQLNGDTFDFKSYIEKTLSTLPKPDTKDIEKFTESASRIGSMFKTTLGNIIK